MRDTDSRILQSLLAGFDRVMLVSRCGDSLRSRPMTLARRSDTRKLWLLSGVAADDLDELATHPQVNVVMQNGVRFCSVTGTARLAAGRDGAGRSPDHPEGWLPRWHKGSELTVVEVSPRVAEYWDRFGLCGLRFEARSASTENRASGERCAPWLRVVGPAPGAQQSDEPRRTPRGRDNVVQLRGPRRER
jgi:general stress protein 26